MMLDPAVATLVRRLAGALWTVKKIHTSLTSTRARA